MARYGYARAELPEEPSRGDVARAMLADLPEAFRFVARGLAVMARLGWGRFPGPAGSQRLVLSINPRARTAHPDWTVPDPPAP
jgi:hypothetical protein